jgi:hypothetical protein
MHIDHAHAEELARSRERRSGSMLVGGDLDEDEFALDRRGIRVELHDLENVEQLVELLDDLLQRTSAPRRR